MVVSAGQTKAGPLGITPCEGRGVGMSIEVERILWSLNTRSGDMTLVSGQLAQNQSTAEEPIKNRINDAKVLINSLLQFQCDTKKSTGHIFHIWRKRYDTIPE